MSPREPGAPEPVAWRTPNLVPGARWIYRDTRPEGGILDAPWRPLYTADAALLMAAERLEEEARRIWPPEALMTDRHIVADHDGYRRAARFLRTLTDSEAP